MSSSYSGSSNSWPYVAASLLAGVSAGYMLGVASSRWLMSRSDAAKPPETTRQPAQLPPSGNLVSALVELTAEVSMVSMRPQSGMAHYSSEPRYLYVL